MLHGNLSSVKYAPSTDRRSENQKMMIKVRHTDCQLFTQKKEHNQTSWKEFIAKNINGVLKLEIEILYPRWPLASTAIAGYSSFHVEATLDITDFEKLNNSVKTFLECRKLLVQS